MSLARMLKSGGTLPPLEPEASTSRCNGKGHDAKAKAGPGRRRVAADRFQTLNTFLDTTARDLIHSQLIVWMLLFRDARDDVARTSQADLARRSGLSERSVRRAIQALEEKGLLSVVRRGRLAEGPSSYRIRPTTKEV